MATRARTSICVSFSTPSISNHLLFANFFDAVIEQLVRRVLRIKVLQEGLASWVPGQVLEPAARAQGAGVRAHRHSHRDAENGG